MIVEDRYIPSDQALRFIAFIRACATEDNANAEGEAGQNQPGGAYGDLV